MKKTRIEPLGRLPHFLIIGAARCGTSSLFSNLLKHPRLRGPYLPATALKIEKECHFFDKKLGDPRMKYTIQWYKDRFVDPCDNLIFFEATPNYLFHPAVPELAKMYIPKAKLIVMLRDPVVRAYSHFYHWKDKNCHTIEKLMVNESEYVQKGIYWQQLERWFRFFNQKRFLIIKSEDFFKDPKSIIGECFEFVGVKSIDFNKKAITYWDPIREYLTSRRSYPPPPEHITRWLRKFYAPHNKKLEKILNRKFEWA